MTAAQPLDRWLNMEAMAWKTTQYPQQKDGSSNLTTMALQQQNFLDGDRQIYQRAEMALWQPQQNGLKGGEASPVVLTVTLFCPVSLAYKDSYYG